MFHSQMCDILCIFLMEVRKVDGSRYPDKTLFEILCSLQKHLELNVHHVQFLNDTKFTRVKLTLDIEMQKFAREHIGDTVV